MKRFIPGFIIYLLVTIPSLALSQENDKSNEYKITPNDIEILIGFWEGTLTYVDYTTGKPFKMPANLKIKQGKNKYQLKLYSIYPNEPKANDTSKFVISKDGEKIDGKPILSKKINQNNEVVFMVEYLGKDGNENKKATIRQFYILGNSSFVIRKEVKFQDQNEWIKRNEFNYLKK